MLSEEIILSLKYQRFILSDGKINAILENHSLLRKQDSIPLHINLKERLN